MKTKAYEVKGSVTYNRIEWKLPKLMASNFFFSFIKIVNKAWFSVFLKKLAPFIKYRKFSDIFEEHIVSYNPDIIHAHDLICLPAGFNAARKCKAKLVYDAHELEVHRHPPLPFFQKQFVSHIEKKYGRKADAVITVGRLIADELTSDLKRNDINVIYNSPIIKESNNNIRHDLRLTADEPLIIYVGKITVGRGIEDVLGMLPNLPDVHFAAIGPYDPKSKKMLENSALKMDVLDRFKLLPPVNYEHVVDYIKGANMGIISSEIVALSYKYAMPNKLFEMSFANVPVLSNKLVEIDAFLRELGNGKTVDFDNSEAIPYHISKFLSLHEQYVLNKEQFRLLEEKYSWTAQKVKLANIYELVQGKCNVVKT
jgi:glycosyltransferase involved in cell wall biosynthesis